MMDTRLKVRSAGRVVSELLFAAATVSVYLHSWCAVITGNLLVPAWPLVQWLVSGVVFFIFAALCVRAGADVKMIGTRRSLVGYQMGVVLLIVIPALLASLSLIWALFLLAIPPIMVLGCVGMIIFAGIRYRQLGVWGLVLYITMTAVTAWWVWSLWTTYAGGV